MNKPIIWAAFAVVVIGSLAYYFLSPSLRLKREVLAEILTFNQAFAGKDQAKIDAELDALLTDDMKISLSGTHQGFGIVEGAPLFKEYFTGKRDFIGFIDSTLAKLTAYRFTVKLTDWHGDGHFVLEAGGAGRASTDYAAGTQAIMHYALDADCRMVLAHRPGPPKIASAECDMKLFSSAGALQGE